MKALVIEDIGQARLRDIPVPRPGKDEVLLRVRHVGLCGSDLSTFRGTNPLSQLPRIPGHEIGGVVAEAGADVSDEFQSGTSAFVIPYTTCGVCAACRHGRPNACKYNQTLGVQTDGGMLDQLVIHPDRLVQNNSLPAPHLALVEPLSVGFHAVSRARITADDTVVVLGGGVIGVGTMLGATSRGARVIAVEISEEKRETLLSIGIDEVINPMRVDLAETLDALTGGFGPDVVIEAVGRPETFRAAVDLVRFTGRVVYVGYAMTEVSYNTSLFNLKELDIMGSRNATKPDFEAVVAFLSGREALADRLISKTFKWADAEQAFEYWETNRSRTFKVMVELDDG